MCLCVRERDAGGDEDAAGKKKGGWKTQMTPETT